MAKQRLPRQLFISVGFHLLGMVWKCVSLFLFSSISRYVNGNNDQKNWRNKHKGWAVSERRKSRIGEINRIEVIGRQGARGANGLKIGAQGRKGCSRGGPRGLRTRLLPRDYVRSILSLRRFAADIPEQGCRDERFVFLAIVCKVTSKPDTTETGKEMLTCNKYLLIIIYRDCQKFILINFDV